MTAENARITLPADEEILITREVAAPPHLVYRAWTTPELVKRWWAGQRGTTTEVELDLRPGGYWRYVLKANAGFEVAFHGEYREIVPGERLVRTEVFELPDAPEPPPALDTTTFTPHGDGHTLVRILVRAASKAWRDTILESGMETGVQEQFALVEELASALQ